MAAEHQWCRFLLIRNPLGSDIDDNTASGQLYWSLKCRQSGLYVIMRKRRRKVTLMQWLVVKVYGKAADTQRK